MTVHWPLVKPQLVVVSKLRGLDDPCQPPSIRQPSPVQPRTLAAGSGTRLGFLVFLLTGDFLENGADT
jgi:hypothetical protein